MPEIDAYRFYQVGKFAFFLVGVIGFMRIFDMWDVMKSYDVFSGVAFAIFQLVMAGFFAKMQKDSLVKEIDDADLLKMNTALDDLKLNSDGGKNAKTKKSV